MTVIKLVEFKSPYGVWKIYWSVSSERYHGTYKLPGDVNSVFEEVFGGQYSPIFPSVQ
jgi:hypothetical protein